MANTLIKLLLESTFKVSSGRIPVLILRQLLTTSLILFSFSEMASAAQPDWICSLSFQGKGTDIQLLVGYSKIIGKGTLDCVNVNGVHDTRVIQATLGTPIVFPRIAFSPSIVIRGTASGITLYQRAPASLIDSYTAVDMMIGRDYMLLKLLNPDSDLNFDLNLKGVEGFGIAVGGTMLTLK